MQTLVIHVYIWILYRHFEYRYKLKFHELILFSNQYSFVIEIHVLIYYIQTLECLSPKNSCFINWKTLVHSRLSGFNYLLICHCDLLAEGLLIFFLLSTSFYVLNLLFHWNKIGISCKKIRIIKRYM